LKQASVYRANNPPGSTVRMAPRGGSLATTLARSQFGPSGFAPTTGRLSWTNPYNATVMWLSLW
jgi:hypothetical protein